MTDVHLPPDLDAFTAACVASGRFPDRDAVHRAALELLKVQESRRAAFAAMLQAAEREGEANGFAEADDVLADLDALIAEAGAGR